jgi:NAD dependent epimerase/dehydratase family enzyme
MSWIHRDDWLSLVEWTLTHHDIEGPVNASAPEPVTNRAFSRALGRSLHRPDWLPVPRLALKILLGELADTALLSGQRAVPARALASGFTFAHPLIGEALSAIFQT